MCAKSARSRSGIVHDRRFRENRLAKVWAQTLLSHQVNFAAEEGAEIVLEPRQFEKALRHPEIYDEVQIGRRSGLAPLYRPKDTEASHVVETTDTG